ncbi:IS701 family transposase (plasmid) [Streptomyces sp. NBC_01450]|uniref:IS701 family transposase n=1 Tax=Streptomyces sp. NBC_01450 TaxID=2903871 RepID=UPI002E32FB54|nr:IS701 family transposase [Streptomyces sp. NBC_01450]
MTTDQDAVAVGATIAGGVWSECFRAAMAAVAACFPRRESRLLARDMAEAMLTGLETRNCWTLAEALGHASPSRLQHFLSRGVWDHDAVRDRTATWAAGELADDDAVLIVDETGDEKSSTDVVGAARQYSGALGGIGLCQVAVHLTYASARGHAPIDRALYLGADWAADEERRLLTHVPDDVDFATKPELAAAMLTRARQLGLRARWFAGDEVYGGRELRRSARRLGFDYALSVRADHQVTTPGGRFTATTLAARLPRRAWMRMLTGHGLKGDRHYDWTWTDIQSDDAPDTEDDGTSVLVVRRHRFTGELSFYRCYSTRPVTLAGLIHIICTRWQVEEDFQLAKGVTGLDQGQTTCWNSWMRWTLISILATAVLAVTRARTATTTMAVGLIPVSARELLTILRATTLPPLRHDIGHVLHWSAWRRRHQAIAQACHRRWNNVTAAATT